MEEGWRGGGCSQNLSRVCRLLFLNKRFIIHFCRWRSQNWSFFADIANVRPLNDLKLQPIQLLEAVVPSSASTQIHFDCHSEHTTSSPLPRSTDDQTKGPVTFSWPLIFNVKKIVA